MQIEKMIQVLFLLKFAKTLVGVEGARLLDKDGNVLVVPQNGLTKTVPVETRTIAASTLTGVVGSDFTLLRAVEVNLSNQTLAGSAELAIPTPANVSSSLPIVVARAIEIRGVKKLKLVALARLSGTLITSYVPSAFSASSAVKGIDSSGLYLFLQAKAPLGFVSGIVKDGAAKAYPSAQVTTSTCSLVDLTGVDGKYLVASTIANFTLTASDIYKNDKGQRVSTITSANQSVSLDVTINVTPPSVVSVSPADGATGVDPKTQIVITMSEAVKPESVTTITVFLNNPAGSKVPGVFSLSPDGTVIIFYPGQNLASETAYTLTVTHSVQDLQGYFMGADFVSRFTIKDTTPPPMPPAGSITSTFPDAEGYVTVTATQGSVEAGCTVLIINDTSGEIVSVTPGTNGAFTGRIMARLGDEIKILMMDAAGNQVLISYITFKSDDGRYLVTAKGGIVEGEGGLKLEIPEGALLGPTVVKITPLTEEQLPQDNPVPPQARFLAGVSIDSGGMGFQKEVKLSVPAPSTMPADATSFVAQPSVHTNADGTQEQVYVIHDSAKVVNGRLTTASPPFDGVMVPGPLAFLFTPAPLDGPVVISGYTYRDMDGIGGYMPGPGENNDKPIKGAVIRSAAANNFISYSKDDGHYAAYGFSTKDVCRSFATTAINPQTMYKHTANITTCDVPYYVNNFNFRLADKDTQIPDTTAPVITMNMQVAPGQGPDARFVAGTVPINTEIQVPITILDQAMETATLTVSYKTPDMNAGQNHSVTLVQAGSTIHTYITAENPAPVYKYTYTPGFNFPIAGSSAGTFKPQNAGSYTFNLEATDAAGNKSSRTMTVRAIQPGISPDGVDGPPQVDELVPADGAKEIMVTMPVMVTFNEPVQNVTTETLKLFSLDYDPNTQQTYENPVAATVYTSLEGGRVRATLQPRTNLTFGKNYKIVITTGITDSVPNSEAVCGAQTPPQPDGCLLPLNRQYIAYFTTKVPQIYDLAEGQFTGGRGIDLYTDPADGKTYVYVAADAEGWYVMDVTDPTAPAVVSTHKMTSAGVTWMNRGVDVDQDNSLLALTEDIRYVSGSQYGYIRFYDLTNNPQGTPPTTPADPKLIGREKLAEAYSGVPMRLSMMNKFAYVATVNVGVQVVDIEAAKAFMQTGGQADGSTIVGIFDTWGAGYRNPNDIVAYKGGRAALTTTSGHLVLLDINIPQLPQEMTAFNPELGPNNPLNFDSAWRVAVASEYAYTPSPLEGEGGGEGTNVIDLAVTSSMAGRIHTVDITDPYNIKVMGVAKDGMGNEVIAPVTDITISKASGLVYATAGMSVYIIDIKDPNNPVLLNVVTQTPTAPGSATLTSLGASSALVEKDGWVYLANQNQGMRVLDLDPIELELEKLDSEYPSVRIYGADYYPALGTKAVKIWGVISGEAFNATNVAEWGLYLVSKDTPTVRVGSMTNGQCQSNTIADNQLITHFTADESVKKGFAKVCLTWTGETTPDMPSTFALKMQARKIGATTMSDATASKIYNFVFDIYHNGRVSMADVISSRKIFAADGLVSRSTGTFENTLGFDFAKELLNQVAPRKRNLVFNAADTNAPNVIPIPQAHGLYVADPKKYPYHSGNTGNSLIDEVGIFEYIRTGPTTSSPTSQALELFRRNFRIGNTKYNSPTDHDASRTMQKILKDYGSNLTNEQKAKLLYQVVDKETLVGNTRLITPENEAVTTANADVLINGTTGNGRDDTGLYELYKNAVERFVNVMTKEAERYAGIGNDLVTYPTATWVSRPTSSNPLSVVGPQQDGQFVNSGRRGMSYSWNGKMNVDLFNDAVSENCGATDEPKVIGYLSITPSILSKKLPKAALRLTEQQNQPETTTVSELYEGNLNATCNVGSAANTKNKYPGLLWHEFNSTTSYNLVADCVDNQCQSYPSAPRATFVFPQYSAKFWAGIDCSGFVQRVVNKAEHPELPNSTTEMPGVSTKVLLLGDSGDFDHYAAAAQNTATLFSKTFDMSYNPQNEAQTLKKVRKGDVVKYPTHMTIIYSDRPMCDGVSKCRYQIIHAYGWHKYQPLDDDGDDDGPTVFSRKVISTKQNITAVPVGFGRIKMWD